MSGIVKFSAVENNIIEVRGEKVILDSVVATLYGVETRVVNQAVKNNPNKFPDGYILELTKEEWTALRSKILTLKTMGRGEHSKYQPKAFTEKGALHACYHSQKRESNGDHHCHCGDVCQDTRVVAHRGRAV